jgi:phage terminase large subunit
MVRKTRESMNSSTVLFFTRKIASRYKEIVHKSSLHRFEYPNGSILAYGGMKDEDQREQIRSIGQDGSLDIVVAEEANKLNFEDHQELLARMRGKAAPYTQIIYMTNPDAPGHWINKELIIDGKATVFYSSALDNPFNPPEYIERLNMLQGVQRARLVEGKWVQAEGVIYDNFDMELNVSEGADYNSEWSVSWGVDDGYADGRGVGTDSYHPRVILLCQQTPEGGLNVFAEYYKTQEADYLNSIDTVLEFGYPKPGLAYIDSSAAMFKANLWNRGITTHGATHPVIEGIRNVRRLIQDANGKVLLHIHPRCKQLISEMQQYQYDEAGQLPTGDRRPAKLNDHGPDALRYRAWSLRYGGSHD